MENSTLGKGTFSVVVKDPNRNIAIKKFHARLGDSAIKEIAIMCYLDHPNLLKANNTNRDSDGVWYIYMRMYDCNLANYIKQSIPDDYSEKFNIVAQLASGLYYMHKMKVIHCDIKPQNILININTKKVVICDFNISIYNADDESEKNGVIQTPCYRAPEVDTKNPYCFYNEKIDIYSLGCVIFEIFTHHYIYNIQYTYDDPTLNLANIFNSEELFKMDRTNRYAILRQIKIETLRDIIEYKIASIWKYTEDKPKEDLNLNSNLNSKLAIKNSLKQKYSFYQDATKKFTNHILNCVSIIVSMCICPNRHTRWAAYDLLNFLTTIKSYYHFEIPPETNYNLPISGLSLSMELNVNKTGQKIKAYSDEIDKIIQNSILVISNKVKDPELVYNATKIEDAILKKIGIKMSRSAVLLEIAYYQKTQQRKVYGEKSTVLTTCACVYLTYCVYEHSSYHLPDCSIIYSYYNKKEIHAKALTIMTELGNKIIY